MALPKGVTTRLKCLSVMFMDIETLVDFGTAFSTFFKRKYARRADCPPRAPILLKSPTLTIDQGPIYKEPQKIKRIELA